MTDRIRLVALSFLMLFTELALIRWTGANVLYLSYFSNFVLLGSFLGIGIGFLRGTQRRNLYPAAPATLAILVVGILAFPIRIERPAGEVLYFGIERGGPPAWLILPLIFVAVAAVMAMIAQGVARAFAVFEPLEAYRLDIVGSILGVAGFSALSFLHAPPVAWGVVAGAFLLASIRPLRALQVVAVLAMVGALLFESLMPTDSWSPYYKVSVHPYGEDLYDVLVNGIPHQAIRTIESRAEIEPIYFTPYARKASSRLDRVLVVGAGNGTDVAIALAQGARVVDAVEIDPRILELGRELHPDRPYDDPRVREHIDDGRAFLERAGPSYDLILFALPDSLTLVSGQSAIRLESYLFTREAMERVRERLKPDGVFAMYNYYREEWLIDRYASTVSRAFDSTPCIDYLHDRRDTHFALITASPSDEAVNCAERWQPSGEVPAAASDDHPFPYLRTRGIPAVYLFVLAGILVASLLAVTRSGARVRSMRPYADLFLMGVAFLLLETTNVVRFALLFGTTWFVNALVFGGILLSVLGAIELTRRTRRLPRGPLFAALFVSLAVAWLVPHDALLQLAIVPRFFAAIAVAFVPVFIANVIFADRFRDVGSSTTAFGANLLGAMVGGLVEYGALAVGYRSLLFVVAALYAGAAVLERGRSGEPARAMS